MTIREELHQLIEGLNEEQLQHALKLFKPMVGKDPFRDLQGVPGIRLPEHWPPEFEDFEPMKVEGELPSRQLIRERR